MSNERSYDSWAEQYDVNENKTRDLDRIVTKETLNKYEFDNVIELGCGTGKNTEWLLTRAKRIFGVDFSGEMLKIARAKIRDDRVEFMKADLTDAWDIKDGFADLITSSLTLEHIKDLGPVFEQAYRKLKKKRYFFICELHPFKQYLGSKARFESNGRVEVLNVYTHHAADYFNSAARAGLKFVEINEWFDNQSEDEVPRLISFIFCKC